MATIGLSDLWYSKITENPTTGDETYATPVRLAKAITADLSIELAENILYADDAAAFAMKEFRDGKLTLNVDDLQTSVVADLAGATVDDSGVLVFTGSDNGSTVAVAFRARRPDNKYRYFWLYKVKFAVPPSNLQTKGEGIEFQTPTIEGTILVRNKLDGSGKKPWKVEATEGDAALASTTLNAWFDAVYEPTYTVAP